MELAGQRISVNICYEDLFGHVIRRAWHDPEREPTIMLNLSNLAWFEDSIALPQHLQISRMRALETQHPMLRATNTGATAIIDASGAVAAQLPNNVAGALDGVVQGQGRPDTVPAVWERARAGAVCADARAGGGDHAHGAASRSVESKTSTAVQYGRAGTDRIHR